MMYTQIFWKKIYGALWYISLTVCFSKKKIKKNSLSVSGWLDATDEADNVVIDGARPGKSPEMHFQIYRYKYELFKIEIFT